MIYLIYFIMTFVITYILSYFLTLRKIKKKGKENNKIPSEVEYMVKKYGIDLKDLDYYKFVRSACLVGSLDMAIIVTVVSVIKNMFFQLLIGFILMIPLILISYKLLAKRYMKGNDKNEHERNRK